MNSFVDLTSDSRSHTRRSKIRTHQIPTKALTHDAAYPTQIRGDSRTGRSATQTSHELNPRSRI
uniref:Uncharacterized protein n=1 Tax=Arundo donax TaxID=35708 RepID=A0A0A9G061_ARUDO